MPEIDFTPLIRMRLNQNRMTQALAQSQPVQWVQPDFHAAFPGPIPFYPEGYQTVAAPVGLQEVPTMANGGTSGTGKVNQLLRRAIRTSQPPPSDPFGGLTANQYADLHKEFLDLTQRIPAGSMTETVTPDPIQVNGRTVEQEPYQTSLLPNFGENPIGAIMTARQMAAAVPEQATDWREAFVKLTDAEQKRINPFAIAEERYNRLKKDTLGNRVMMGPDGKEEPISFNDFFRRDARLFRSQAASAARRLLPGTNVGIGDIEDWLYSQGATELTPGSGLYSGSIPWSNPNDPNFTAAIYRLGTVYGDNKKAITDDLVRGARAEFYNVDREQVEKLVDRAFETLSTLNAPSMELPQELDREMRRSIVSGMSAAGVPGSGLMEFLGTGTVTPRRATTPNPNTNLILQGLFNPFQRIVL